MKDSLSHNGPCSHISWRRHGRAASLLCFAPHPHQKCLHHQAVCVTLQATEIFPWVMVHVHFYQTPPLAWPRNIPEWKSGVRMDTYYNTALSPVWSWCGWCHTGFLMNTLPTQWRTRAVPIVDLWVPHTTQGHQNVLRHTEIITLCQSVIHAECNSSCYFGTSRFSLLIYELA